MQRLVAALATLALATPAAAADPPKVRMLQESYKAGFKDCAASLETFVQFIHDDDEAYGYVSTWSTKKPNGEMMGALTSEGFTDGQGVTTFSAAKTASGDCDVSVTQTLVLPGAPCDELQKTTFKDWKFYTELNGVNVLEDPQDSNTNVALTPIGKTGCVVVKHMMGFGV